MNCFLFYGPDAKYRILKCTQKECRGDHWSPLSVSKNLVIALARQRPKPPLCKGRCPKFLILDGGVVIQQYEFA